MSNRSDGRRRTRLAVGNAGFDSLPSHVNTPPAPGTRQVIIDIPDDITLRIGAGAVLGQPWGDLWLVTPHPALDGHTPSKIAAAGQHQTVARWLVDLHRQDGAAIADEIVRVREYAVAAGVTNLPTLDWLRT